MGQAKFNPTAIAAKEGKIPPKQKKLGKPATRRMIMNELSRRMGLQALFGGNGREVYKDDPSK